MHKSFDLRGASRRTADEATAGNARAPETDHDDPLKGKNVLVAEDEVLVAMTLVDLVEDVGAQPIGPFASVRECRAALEQTHPDIAILDVRLLDGESFCIAETLVDNGVPVVFHSGHMAAQEWRGNPDLVHFCGKPCSPTKMEETLRDAVAG